MTNVLLTGNAGFVGRHILKKLRDDRDTQVYGIDIKQGQDCRDFFRDNTQLPGAIDLVVHCAAVVGGRTMIDGEPLKLITEDLTIDAEMFRWALRMRPKRIVYFSSSAAYPVTLQEQHTAERLRESDVGSDPDATYGWVKLTGERMAEEANAEGIRTHVFRPFSGYGWDQDDTYPFPAIMQRASVHVPGDVFNVWGHPESTRDWVHISDVVNCVMAHIEEDVIGPVNICTGIGTSFEELATLALKANGHTGIRVVGDRTKPMGVFHRVGDPTLMAQVYTPKVTLADAVRQDYSQS